MYFSQKLDSDWSKILGFPIIELRKGEIKLVSIEQQIEVPPIDRTGSPGRTRTYNLAVNSRPLYH